MRTSVEPLEGNKVKLSVEVDEQEFEKAIDPASSPAVMSISGGAMASTSLSRSAAA